MWIDMHKIDEDQMGDAAYSKEDRHEEQQAQEALKIRGNDDVLCR
jgi:hypothetical protein